jgi:Uma2 family endonuclease
MAAGVVPPLRQPEIVIYPDSDGQPISDNTLQFEYIVTVKGGLEALFRHDPNVFVAGDLLWYPVEGEPKVRTAPDALVAFGRPKGYRGSYKQWLEGNVPPQVVFEILSPGSRHGDWIRKFNFYERYGVEEYYVYDPDRGTVEGWLRKGSRLEEIPDMQHWVSPRLNVRFELLNGELHLYGPDGQRFATYVELVEQQQGERRDKERAQRQAEQAQRHAEQARQQAEQAHRQAEQSRQQAEQAQHQAEQAKQRAEQLAAQLRAMGIEPET